MLGFRRLSASTSIFHQVLLVNTLIVFAFGSLGTYASDTRLQADPLSVHGDLLLIAVVVAGIVSLAVNFIALRLILRPLRQLTETVAAVQAGDQSARAPYPLGDREIDRLATTINQMLDAVADYRAEIRRLASQAIRAQEQERKRVARELHDETAQSLTSLLVRLRIAERSDTVDEMRAAFGDLRALTVQTLDEVRNLSLELRPSALDDLGLVPALRWYAGRYADHHAVPVSLDAQDLDVRLDPTIELVLYRVVQEALTNAAKHAAPTRIDIALARDADAVSGRVSDDGRGFDVEAYLGRTGDESRGLGIFGMQERLGIVGGALDVASRPGAGTTLTFRIPLARAAVAPPSGPENALAGLPVGHRQIGHPERGDSRDSETPPLASRGVMDPPAELQGDADAVGDARSEP